MDHSKNLFCRLDKRFDQTKPMLFLVSSKLNVIKWIVFYWSKASFTMLSSNVFTGAMVPE